MRRRWLLLIFLILLGCQDAFAQQTIFNVPSADAVPEGEVFLQHYRALHSRLAS